MRKKIPTKTKTDTLTPPISSHGLNKIREKVFDAINEKELRDFLNDWLKKSKDLPNRQVRDFEILRNVITEYLDSFIVFGYSMDGERIMISNYKNSKDKDAMMEFLKIVFFKYQNEGDE